MLLVKDEERWQRLHNPAIGLPVQAMLTKSAADAMASATGMAFSGESGEGLDIEQPLRGLDTLAASAPPDQGQRVQRESHIDLSNCGELPSTAMRAPAKGAVISTSTRNVVPCRKSGQLLGVTEIRPWWRLSP